MILDFQIKIDFKQAKVMNKNEKEEKRIFLFFLAMAKITLAKKDFFPPSPPSF